MEFLLFTKKEQPEAAHVSEYVRLDVPVTDQFCSINVISGFGPLGLDTPVIMATCPSPFGPANVRMSSGSGGTDPALAKNVRAYGVAHD
jgi:hypothetical protein